MAWSVAGRPSWVGAKSMRPAGGVTTGAVWSITVTVAVAVPVFPAESVAEKVTVVTPTGNTAG